MVQGELCSRSFAPSQLPREREEQSKRKGRSFECNEGCAGRVRPLGTSPQGFGLLELLDRTDGSPATDPLRPPTITPHEIRIPFWLATTSLAIARARPSRRVWRATATPSEACLAGRDVLFS